jgi:Na+/melibiose symporter-like transporter
MGLMVILGTVGSLAVASLLLGQGGGPGRALAEGIAHGAAIFYWVAAGVVALGVVVTLFAVREHGHPHVFRLHRHAAAHGTAGVSRRERLARMWVHPWRHRNFRWVFLTRAFVMLGLALFATYIEYYFARVAHVTSFVQATAINAVLALVGAICSTLVLGVISDRAKRRVPIVAGSAAFMALTALAFVVAPGQIPLWPLGIMFGLGYGAYMSVDVALAVDALPSEHEAGKDLGIFGTASTLPGIAAPLVGSVVIFVADSFGQTALGYRGVFALATVFLALGAIFVLKVRESRHEKHAEKGLAAADARADEAEVEAVV